MKPLLGAVGSFGIALMFGCQTKDGSKTKTSSEHTMQEVLEVTFGKVPEGPGDHDGCYNYLFKTNFSGGTAEELDTYCRDKTRAVTEKVQGYQLKKGDGSWGNCEPVAKMDPYEACFSYATKDGRPVDPTDAEEVQAGSTVRFTTYLEGQPGGDVCAAYVFQTKLPGGKRADLKEYCRNGTRVSGKVAGYTVKNGQGNWGPCQPLGEMEAYQACLSHAAEQ